MARSWRSWFTYERLLGLLIALNLIDAVSTHAILVMAGPGGELNPVMRWAWETSPAFFWTLKGCLLASGMLLLAKFASEKVAKAVLAGACTIYLVIVAIHAQGWLQYLVGP